MQDYLKIGDTLFENIKRQSSELAAKRRREAHNRKMKKYRQKQENKASIAESKRQHYENNKEAMKEKAQKHYEDNKEAMKVKAKQHYEENKESIRDVQKDYYKTNKEIIKKKKKEAKVYISPFKDFGKKIYPMKHDHLEYKPRSSIPPWFHIVNSNSTPEQIATSLVQHLYTPEALREMHKTMKALRESKKSKQETSANDQNTL